MGESVWVLGASMTKISRYPDKDVIDLAAEATFNALDDAGVSIFDIQVLAAGSMFNMGGIGQQVAKQVGQTGIPIYNVVNACATGATAVRTALVEIQAGNADFGLAIGAEQMGKMGLLAGNAARRRREQVRARGPLRRRHAGRRLARFRHDAGGVRPGGHGVRLQERRRRLRAVRQGRAEEPRALGAEPARAVQQGVHARGDHGRPRDLVPQHAADVLPHRRRCRGDRARVGVEAARPSRSSSRSAR